MAKRGQNTKEQDTTGKITNRTKYTHDKIKMRQNTKQLNTN